MRPTFLKPGLRCLYALNLNIAPVRVSTTSLLLWVIFLLLYLISIICAISTCDEGGNEGRGKGGGESGACCGGKTRITEAAPSNGRAVGACGLVNGCHIRNRNAPPKMV